MGIHYPSKLRISFYVHSMEIILLPTCGYIYSVPICDVYLLIWTWLHRLISGGNYLNYEARIISLHLPVSKAQSIRSPPGYTNGSPDSKAQYVTFVSTPKLSTSTAHLICIKTSLSGLPISPGFTPPDTVLSLKDLIPYYTLD